MKFSTVIILLFIIFVPKTSAQPQHVKVQAGGNKLIENFENEEVGALPQRWYNQRASTAVADMDMETRNAYPYKIVQEDGNKFLRFHGTRGMHLNFPTKQVDNINIYNTPILSWRWRIWDIPAGANEDNKNDVAASIYVVFDLGHVLFKKVPKSIRYTWSSSLEKGTELTKLFGNQKIIVVGTGNDKQGQWQTFQRNIVEDYKRLFGDKPPKTPLAILILSDGDNTGDVVKADYDDIMLKPAKN